MIWAGSGGPFGHIEGDAGGTGAVPACGYGDQPAHPGRSRGLDAAPDPVGQLAVLQAAVFTDRRLRLRYRSGGRGMPDRARRLRRPANGWWTRTGGCARRGSGTWWPIPAGEPRLFRVSRVLSAAVDEAPVRRRDGVELAELWELLRRESKSGPPRWW